MLEDQYTTWAKCKELVLFEEMTQSKYKNHSISSMLKDLQASDKVMIREMRTNSYPIDNYMTMIFNSNSFPPVFLEQHDTRHFCMSLNEEHWGQDNFKAFYSWLRTKDGLQKIRHYLEAHDYKDFNPNKPAPATKLKGTMVQENLSQEVEWIKHHLIDNRHRIGNTARELYTGDDLYQSFITDVEPARRPNKLSFYKKITRYGGFEKKQFKLSQNFSPRYYIITTDIKRSHYWLHDAKAEDVRKHLKSFGEMVPEDAKPAKFKR